MELDGSIPTDNPFTGSYTFSLGHRNPQGIGWHPETGEAYETENGPDRFDEMNRIHAGGNFGWPDITCSTNSAGNAKGPSDAQFRGPLACYETFTFAPSGLTFVSDRDSPWYGSMFVAGMRGKHLRRYRVEGDQLLEEEIAFVADNSRVSGDRRLHRSLSRRLRDVKFHDGWLYIIGDQFGMVRIRPDGPADVALVR